MNATATKSTTGRVTADTITEEEALTVFDLCEYWCAERKQPFTPFPQVTCDALVAYLRILGEVKVREAMDIGVAKHCENIGFVIKTLKNWQERKAYASQFTTMERAMYLREKARKGGESTSEAKADAARENGKLGGRPRKVEPTPIVAPVQSDEDEDLSRFDDDAPAYIPPPTVHAAADDDDEDLSRFDD